MGGKGSGRVGRRPYDEQLAIQELLMYSLTTLKRVLLDPNTSDDRKAQIALVLASRRVGNKQEHSINTIPLQEQAILDKYISTNKLEQAEVRQLPSPEASKPEDVRGTD